LFSQIASVCTFLVIGVILIIYTIPRSQNKPLVNILEFGMSCNFLWPESYTRVKGDRMETKKLVRIPSRGMIGGVCAGLGEYLQTDPTIIRLIFVLLALAGMSGVLIYIIMWLIVPVKASDSLRSQTGQEEAHDKLNANAEE
jgi:phage shock protein C